jgi:hypothetical protein
MGAYEYEAKVLETDLPSWLVILMAMAEMIWLG